MRVLITGDKGFIASNLPRAFQELGHIVVPGACLKFPHVLASTGEMCVFRNDERLWEKELRFLGIDVVVHNAAVVGTDVVALNPEEATLTNVTGTYNICRAANNLGIPVLYIGTTVIYDTAKYQDTPIVEDSSHAPKTLYGALKLAGENIVKSHCKKWAIARPLFCYGGVGDNNSLISKIFYGSVNNKSKIDMFLDPYKIKDYMHVNDFCDAIATIVDNGLWGSDWNVSAETPNAINDIVSMMSSVACKDVSSIIEWHPGTDYLGNHRLSSEKFRKASGWSPKIDIFTGLLSSWDSINRNVGTAFNPLQHLETAKKLGIDLTKYF